MYPEQASSNLCNQMVSVTQSKTKPEVFLRYFHVYVVDSFNFVLCMCVYCHILECDLYRAVLRSIKRKQCGCWRGQCPSTIQVWRENSSMILCWGLLMLNNMRKSSCTLISVAFPCNIAVRVRSFQFMLQCSFFFRSWRRLRDGNAAIIGRESFACSS